jgi:thiamine-phosphate diphosphorylase
MRTLSLPPVYALTDRRISGVESIPEMARRLFRVGIRLLQVREKDLADRALLAAVEESAGEARAAGATLVVDDRPDVARIADVGVHLGEDDLPAEAARRLLPEQLLGVSTHDPAATHAAFTDPSPDYVAFGPVLASRTRPAREARGLAALERAAQGKTRPLVAIGGITAETLPAVLAAGADSAAMIAGLLEGGRLEDRARQALDAARRARAPRRIFLVGFMGSGKTSVGRRVAQRLEVPFVDLDEEIERASGLTVRALFETKGEAAFRSHEAALLQASAALPAAVVATGGGAFTFEENRRVIRGLGPSIFLDLPFAALRGRLGGKTDRPLFSSAAAAAALWSQRQPAYLEADVRVALTGRESLEESADAVLIALDERDRRGRIVVP